MSYNALNLLKAYSFQVLSKGLSGFQMHVHMNRRKKRKKKKKKAHASSKLLDSNFYYVIQE